MNNELNEGCVAHAEETIDALHNLCQDISIDIKLAFVEVESLREENERLKTENEQLKAAQNTTVRKKAKKILPRRQTQGLDYDGEDPFHEERRSRFIKAHNVTHIDDRDDDWFETKSLYLHPSILNPSVFNEELVEDDYFNGSYNGECLDHSDIWEKDGMPYLMTSQPYQVSKEDLKLLIAHCDKYDIDFQIDAASFYCSPLTIRILFNKTEVSLHDAVAHEYVKGSSSCQ